jgi:hypothetical protein
LDVFIVVYSSVIKLIQFEIDSEGGDEKESIPFLYKI